jgi:hypothetical protein
MEPTFFASQEKALEHLAKDFELRINSCNLPISKIKNNPLIVDIGCGDFPHFFLMSALFPDGFTYIGIDKFLPPGSEKDAKKYIEILKKEFPHFHFYQMDAQSRPDQRTFAKFLKENMGRADVDLVLIEHIAVGVSDNKATDDLLESVTHFVPKILSSRGSMHIEAASDHQRDVITSLLKNNNWKYFNIDRNNFCCGEMSKLISQPNPPLPPRKGRGT